MSKFDKYFEAIDCKVEWGKSGYEVTVNRGELYEILDNIYRDTIYDIINESKKLLVCDKEEINKLCHQLIYENEIHNNY